MISYILQEGFRSDGDGIWDWNLSEFVAGAGSLEESDLGLVSLWCRLLEGGQVSLGDAEVIQSNCCQQSLTGNLGNRGSWEGGKLGGGGTGYPGGK
ncbi:hypothetical protein CRENBAI_001694 [Crenichthys baileyi]|uniref:Uncharacterized protein n=1 Tax=Crenichthys baileyi TaxID=28760 RepID=A0AAV9RGZ4_9TELE